MKLSALRNYVLVFALAWGVILVTKFVFLGFHGSRFADYGMAERIGAIFWGTRFDLAMAAIVAWLANLFNFNARLLQNVSAGLLALLALMQLGDILYFADASRHVGYEITDALQDAEALLLTALTQHTAFTVSALILLPILFLGFHRVLQGRLASIRPLWHWPLSFFALLLLSVFFVRGMAQPIPLNPWQASKIGDPRLANLALNGAYSMVFALFEPSGQLRPRFDIPATPAEIRESFATLYADEPAPAPAPARRPNVVLFFLEGWSALHMSAYGYPAATTPFYDSLLSEALWPRGTLAGGHRTTEGIFTTLVSYQNPLGRSVANTRLQDHPYDALIPLFNAAGYHSLFFQGTSKETSGTGAFAQKLGFRESYGKADVVERRYPPNSWGVQDPDLYAFVLKRLAKLEPPFIIGINGATTHDIVIPDEIPILPLAEDDNLNRRLNALHFADQALGEFVRQMHARYPETLFVFLADHTGWVPGTFENYLIPLAFVGPGVPARHIDHVVSQRDIAPTVVDLVFGDYRQRAPNFSGKSLLRDRRFFADYYHNGVLGWVEGDRVVEYLPATATTRCFSLDGLVRTASPCDEKSNTMAIRLRAFTHVSQKLLFAGRTQEFHCYREGAAP